MCAYFTQTHSHHFVVYISVSQIEVLKETKKKTVTRDRHDSIHYLAPGAQEVPVQPGL